MNKPLGEQAAGTSHLVRRRTSPGSRVARHLARGVETTRHAKWRPGGWQGRVDGGVVCGRGGGTGLTGGLGGVAASQVFRSGS